MLIDKLASNLESLPWLVPVITIFITWLILLLLPIIFKTLPSRCIELITGAGLLFSLYTTQFSYKLLAGNSFIELSNQLLKFERITLGAHLLLLASAILTLFIPLNKSTGVHSKTTSFAYVMLLPILLGAYCLAAANHWLIAYLSIVFMALGSLPIIGGNHMPIIARQYLLYSILGTALMAWGLSYRYGLVGNLYLDQTGLVYHNSLGQDHSVLLGILSFLFPILGILMPLGCFPFQFWVCNVYQSIDCREAAYLSTIPKIGLAAFLLRFWQSSTNFLPNEAILSNIWIILSIFTIVLGHLAALHTKQAKKLLAAGTIAHTGVICAAILVKTSHMPVIYYILVYSFMNIAAWMGAQILTRPMQGFSFTIQDYAGWGHKRPLEAIGYTCIMLALIGLPPTAGFMAKLHIIIPLWQLYQSTHNPLLPLLLTTVAIGTLLSLYYYLKIPYQLFFGKPLQTLPLSKLSWVGGLLLLLAMFLVFLFFNYRLIVTFLTLWLASI